MSASLYMPSSSYYGPQRLFFHWQHLSFRVLFSPPVCLRCHPGSMNAQDSVAACIQGFSAVVRNSNSGSTERCSCQPLGNFRSVSASPPQGCTDWSGTLTGKICAGLLTEKACHRQRAAESAARDSFSERRGLLQGLQAELSQWGANLQLHPFSSTIQLTDSLKDTDRQERIQRRTADMIILGAILR